MLALKIIGIVLLVLVILFILLFIIYFFNLDMKFTVNVIGKFLEKHYDKRDKNQYV